MFEIEYKGGNGVIISTKKASVVFDPRLSVVGLKDLNTKDSIEAATESRLGVSDKDARLVIEGPGDYEISDFSLHGVPAMRHIDTEVDGQASTMYRIEVGDVRIAVLGNIAPKLSDDQQEEIGVIDILILPVGGGGYTLDATSAAGIVRQLDPKVVIPIHYADTAVSYEVPQDTLEVFTKELAAPVDEAVVKYKVKAASSIPQVLTVAPVTRS